MPITPSFGISFRRRFQVQLEDPAPQSSPRTFRQTRKLARTPHVDEGSLVSTDQEDRGQLSNVAARPVMEFTWLDRINQPDLLVAINACAGHITRWTVNDDKRMARLAGYVAATLDHSHVMQIHDRPSDLRPSLYADAEFGSIPGMRSTSGYLLALEGPQSFVQLKLSFSHCQPHFFNEAMF